MNFSPNSVVYMLLETMEVAGRTQGSSALLSLADLDCSTCFNNKFWWQICYTRYDWFRYGYEAHSGGSCCCCSCDIGKQSQLQLRQVQVQLSSKLGWSLTKSPN